MCAEKITNLAKAMLEVQRAVRPACKDKLNDFTHSRYATLNSVMEACGEALINAGIWVTQYPVPVDGKRLTSGTSDQAGTCRIRRMAGISAGHSLCLRLIRRVMVRL